MAWTCGTRPLAGKLVLTLVLLSALLVLVLSRMDFPEIARLLQGVGPAGVLLLAPYALMLSLDSLAWGLLFNPRQRPSLRTLLVTRAATESVAQSLPSAGVAGDAAALWRLAALGRVQTDVVLATLAARRVLLIIGHGSTLVLAALVAASPMHRLMLGLVATLVLAAGLAAGAVARSSPAMRTHRVLRRMPLPSALQARIAALNGRFPETDRHLRRFFAEPGQRLLAPTFLFCLVYLAESFETWLILALLGARLGFSEVLTFEAPLSLVRALAFFVPAGLGVQDLGYLGFLGLLGVPHAASVGAAFLVLKRAKEVFWILVGYAALAAGEDESERVTPRSLHLRVAQPDHADASDRPGAARA